MSITRVHEDPRVTKPYSDAQWADIDALGHRVDADLAAHDVRLTQGGEPTFVSIDDMEGAEWNFAALSPKKRELAEVLLRRLAKRFAPGGFLHMGQGKWYPGEPLPRWALGVYWRDDGDSALARSRAARRHASRRATPTSATRSGSPRNGGRARPRSGVRDDRVRGRPEAARRRNRRSRRMWTRCRPISRKPAERARLARLLQQGLERPVGFVLPLKASHARGRGLCRLDEQPVAAASRAALCARRRFAARLALAAVLAPDVLPEDEDIEPPVDPFAPRGDLPEPGSDARRPQPGRKANRAAVAPREVVKTALCVEMRDGHVFVFMPPLKRLEDYVALLARSRAPPRASGARSPSRATRRRATRASRSSTSRPIRA